MTEQTAEATETVTEEQTEAPTPKPTETVEFWKQKAREQESRAKSNADAAQRLAALEESQKTETQKLAEERDVMRAERDALRVESLRSRVAIEKSVSSDLLEFLTATDEDELNAQADRLLMKVAEAAKSSGPQRFGAVDQGVRQSTPPADAGEREVARALFGTP